MSRRWLGLALVLGLLSTCEAEEPVLTGRDLQSTTTLMPSQLRAPPSDPQPNVELLWNATFGLADSPVLRFVAEVRNPTDQARSGVETEWVAFDESGAIVGSFRKSQPVVPAGGSVVYAGGAGAINLSGQPTSVALTITDPGSAAEETEEPTVAEVELTETEFPFGNEPEYEVSAVVTVPGPTASSRLDVMTVLRGAGGEIVGADFLDLANAPIQLAGGARVRVQGTVLATTGGASSADVFAYLGSNT